MLLEGSGLLSSIKLSISDGRLQELTGNLELLIDAAQISPHPMGRSFVLPELPVGRYSLVVTMGEKVRQVEKFFFSVCPSWEIDTSINPNPAFNSTTNQLTIGIKSTPSLWPAQSVALLLNSRSFSFTPLNKTDAATFTADQVNTGDTFWVRLRVDGIDSWLVDLTSELPAFDDKLQIKATP